MTPRNSSSQPWRQPSCTGSIRQSPLFLMSYILTPLWIPDLIPLTQESWFYFASLMTATVTLLLSAMPAGLFERFTGRTQSDNISMMVWLGGAIVISLPGLLTVLG